ncbi:MAG: carbon-nitrogen hydrolase family protein [Candidatus Thalassarchaeaceae archaeon]|nr:carbon-nitrogen hydrolase family protein [Candidatus Thalassarchaeaceae archaeon]
MKVAVIQMSPVFLDKSASWEKLKTLILEAVGEGARVITWGETLIPGYPVWMGLTDSARWDNPDQKRAYATYVRESVSFDGSIVAEMRKISSEHGVMLMGGILEGGGSSVFATLLTIGFEGEILGRHRKIKPTFDERLLWADGDTEGLRVYETPEGRIGGLNCWENWIPLTRAALHQEGEMIHVAVWPGSYSLTKDITRFMALEGRSWILSACGVYRGEDFGHLSLDDFPMRDEMMKVGGIHSGGSLIANPIGEIIAGPLPDYEEGILYADVDRRTVLEERQNFDYSGHYSRPDLLRITRS